ncbi:MAG: hypothetical protein J0I45_09435 [Bosea sp.]|nr:hypothetical protein [Bosea sp. (in: a-proteobacteria)]
MSASVQRFINRLAMSSAGMRAAREHAGSASVGGEAALPLTLLALGQRLADDLVRGGEDDCAAFEAIEEAFIDDDPELSEASSRVIEAAVGRAVERETLPELRVKFGERSGEKALTYVALDR